MPNVQELAAPVKLVLMDVDGVLTDGRLYNVPDAAGNMVETKAFDSQDGIALQWLSWKGIKTGLISGRVSPATIERAKQTKFTYVYQGHIEKIPILDEILADSGLDKSQVAYIGDDLTDIAKVQPACQKFPSDLHWTSKVRRKNPCCPSAFVSPI